MAEQLKVIVVGASGMVGAAVLKECLDQPCVETVLALGRAACGQQHPKLKELLLPDLLDLGPVSEQLRGYNACFLTVGASALGRAEEEYSRLNHDLPLSLARALLGLNPGMALTYVSGAGCDATEKGKVMWARVKGRTENALLAMGFKPAVMFRLAGLVALKGFQSKTALYRIPYLLISPLLPLLARAFPHQVTTPHILGQAMIRAAQGKSPMARLEPADIHALGKD